MASFNADDHRRVYRLYYYLCTCLAIKQRPDGTPNYKGTSDRFADRDLRRQVSRLLQAGAEGYRDLPASGLGSVTTGDIVKMLAQLRSSLQSEYQQHREPYTRVLTAEDMLSVLYRLVELTPAEKQQLNLMPGDGLILLQRTLLMLQATGGTASYRTLLQLYKTAVGLDETPAGEPLHSIKQVDDLIEETVRAALAYLPDKPSSNGSPTQPSRKETQKALTLKAQREIRRLLARSGNQQSLVPGSMVVDAYIRHYLQPAFVSKLAQAIVANERLTDQFPVYLKRITLEASGPLPFADKELGGLTDEGAYPPLLHPVLRQLDRFSRGRRPGDPQGDPDLPGPGDYELASQEATRVVVEFYIKVPANYRPSITRVFEQLASEDQQRIDFSLSSTGIGGALSHVIKVINTALLMDIACLKDYFSIAHDVACTQTIIRDNVSSPVWAHSLVKLCRKETVGETLQHCDRNTLPSYEDYAFADPIGHGDYCGFDFLLSQAQAALQARLQAIRNAGVMPQIYVGHLCHRIEQWMALQDAWSYLRGYPFSSLAMIGAINREILRPHVGNRPLTKQDDYIYFDACLSIVEALLDEGAYRPACRYLQRLRVLEDYVRQGLNVASTSASPEEPAFEVFSGGLLVRYLLCKASYHYYYDTADRDRRYLPLDCDPDINREGLIQRAWATLEQAQHHVAVRLHKYVIINEVSQGTFHPHYCLLARIAALRAKMLLFFPQAVRRNEYLPTERFSGQRRTAASIHWGRLYLAEKARLYAAADGDSEVYACHAALQCWLHLIAAYASPSDLTLPPAGDRGAADQILSSHSCLKWAKQLRDHALISYADTGRQCYYQIKEKSGLPEETDEFGLYCIQKLPAIYEDRSPLYGQPGPTNRDLLVLDISLLAIEASSLPKVSPNRPTRNIYLFGTNACYLLFARGLYLLCSPTSEEFEPLPAAADTAPIQWEAKLLRAMRLLNLAWAIAEQGGTVEKDRTSAELKLNILRRFTPRPQSGQYGSSEVESVRDLHPRRVSEIADLGKIFSAACMVLRLHGAAAGDQPQLRADLEALLGSLHSANSLSRTARAIMARQRRHNGHLQTYLNQAKAILLTHADQAQTQPAGLDLRQQRDDLIKALFDALGT